MIWAFICKFCTRMGMSSHSVLSLILQFTSYSVKCKDLPYSLPSVGPGADPGVQVSPQVTLAVGCHCFLSPSFDPYQVIPKLYCMVTDAHTHRCDQLAHLNLQT